MTRALIQTSFNAGELSRRLEGRVDLNLYQIGCRSLVNMIPTVQGPAVKRSGTRFVAPARGPGVLLPFEFSRTQAYVIEATPGIFRFYTNDARIEVMPGVPYELAVPYDADSLAALDWEQSRDVLYLADGRGPLQRLARTGATTFALAPAALENGPFADQNLDDSVILTASGTDGSVTLVASAPIFLPGHLGALLEIEARDFGSVPAWEPQVEVALGARRRSDGKVYEAVQLPASGSKRTGTDRPIHEEGDAWDGTSNGDDYNGNANGGVLWRYLYGRAGIVQLTAIIDPVSAVATVVKRLPDEVATAGTSLWAHGAFSDAAGWPTHVLIRDERLWLAKDNQLFASVAGSLLDFSTRDGSGLPQPDLGLRLRLPEPEPIAWMANDRALLVGTAGSEWAVGAINPALAVAYNNVRVERQSAHGSEPVKPVGLASSTLFVSRGGRRLRAADYQFERDKYLSPDLTLRAQHIARAGIVRMARATEPEDNVWLLLADGQLRSLTWNDEEQVRSFARHRIAGPMAAVESIASIPAPDGTRDQLWLLVRRTLGTGQVRWVERLLPLWEEGDAQDGGCFLDGSLTYEGAPATLISGLWHLEGETVQVVADGAVHPDRTVTAGQITLERPAATVHAGWFFPAELAPMRLSIETEGGVAHAKMKRVPKLALGLLETLGVRVRQDDGPAEVIHFRSGAMPMDAPVPLFSGEIVAGLPGRFAREARIVVESWQPFPMTLLSLGPRLAVGELD